MLSNKHPNTDIIINKNLLSVEITKNIFKNEDLTGFIHVIIHYSKLALYGHTQFCSRLSGYTFHVTITMLYINISPNINDL